MAARRSGRSRSVQDPVGQAVPRKLAFEDHVRAARVAERRGVGRLVVVGRLGEGDEDGRFPGGDELGAARRPGPAEDEVGRGEPGGHVGEKRLRPRPGRSPRPA